ncbi:MAG: NAD(P)/FAD-dependent oxidoreductase [Clostridia bacterium]|nr:NAD(P)/FAD-dependent oxidoreductase [Clostridia bacterium]
MPEQGDSVRGKERGGVKNYVIIGNGAAAIGCIEGIRSVDSEGAITVVSKEPHHVYSRPLISYYLEGKTDLERMNYRAPDFYVKAGCGVLRGDSAVKIDSAAKTVTTEKGKTLPYDALCVAAGSSPFVPPFEGLDTVENKFGFMTLDDALALEKALTPETRVLIVGAGLIGLKCAEGIRDRVKSITVCDLADRVLSSILDADCASVIQRHLEENGISFLLSDSAARFDKNVAYMKSGAEVGFDVLVLAVGVRANSALVRDAGGEVNRGVIIDTRMKTSLPDIYAAGDCAEGYDASLGANRVLAILPNAYMQGHTAGVNMAGGDAVFDNAIPMNSIGFFGLHIMSAGSYDGDMTEIKDGGTLKRFFVKEGLLNGFMLIGGTERAGIYTSLIRERVPLDTIDFESAEKIASNSIFSSEIRRKKFGGVV